MTDTGGCRSLVLATMCIGQFLALLDVTIVNVALPEIGRDLGSGVSGQQWVVDSYVLAFAGLLLTGGTLADRFGAKRVFVAGMALFAVGSVVAGFAPDLGTIITGRAVQGAGAAIFSPATLSILTSTFPRPADRARAIGIWSATSGVALVVGPVAGGSLVETAGWQSIFFVNPVIAIGGLLLAARFVAGAAVAAGRRVDLAGQAVVVVSLVALTFALIEGAALGWGSAPIVWSFVAASVGLAVFLALETHSDHPMLPLELFRGGTFVACNVVLLLAGFGRLGSFFFLSLFLQQIQRYPAFAAGARLLPMMGAIILVAPFAGRLAGRLGSRWPMTAGMALTGIGLLLLLGLAPDTPYGTWWPALLPVGLGLGLVMAPTNAALVGSVEPGRAGMASATGSAAQQLGGLVGVAVFGALVNARIAAAVRDAAPAPAAQGALEEAFVVGVRHGLLLGGIAFLVGAVTAVVLVRPSCEWRQGSASAVETTRADASG